MKRSLAILYTLTLAALAAGPARAGYRLDKVVVPTAESVTLKLDADQPDYSGSVRIELKASAAADSFQLNVRNLKITSLSLAAGSGAVPVTYHDAPFERITVVPAKKLAPGTYTLDIAFTNAFDVKATGLYRTKFGDDWYAFTQFESVDARQAFPCWDEPEFKIPWRLTLTVPAKHRAFANTTVEEQTDKDGQRTFVFKTTRPMPSYLVAFTTGPLEIVDIPGMSVPGVIVTVKGQRQLAAEAVKMTPPILAALEEYFKRPYPYEKLDLVAVPDYNYGAMENAGLVTFSDRVLLIDPAVQSVQQRRRLAAVIAHELAHMWFGDLVTMKWWDDLWLNESFASWMGDKITHKVFPEFEMPIAELEGTARAYREDDQLATRAIRQKVDETVNLEQIADALAYEKGQCMLGMFESWMGPDKFRSGVVDYINTYAWTNAEAGDLWGALSKAGGQDIGPAMSTFLDQPGVPLVNVEVMGPGKLRLSQQRYASYGRTAPSQLWKIPVVMRFSDGKQVHTQRVMLTEATQTVALKPAVTPTWLHPNADERGYYHWNMSSAKLVELMDKYRNELTPRERVGYLTNSDVLLDAGVLHGDDFLRALVRCGEDPQPQVVQAGLRGLQTIQTSFVTPSLQDAYANYVRLAFRPALNRIGLERRTGEAETVAALRAELLGTLGEWGHDPEVMAKGRAIAKAYVADPKSADPALAETGLHLSALEGDAALFDTYQSRFEKAQTPSERRYYLSSLGYFRDAKLVDRAMQYAVEGPLRPQEMNAIFSGFHTPPLRDKVWAFFQANYEKIAGRIPPAYRTFLPYMAAGCERERIESAKTFFAQPEHAPFGTDKEVAKVVEGIETCVSLRDRDGEGVAKALNALTAAK